MASFLLILKATCMPFRYLFINNLFNKDLTKQQDNKQRLIKQVSLTQSANNVRFATK